MATVGMDKKEEMAVTVETVAMGNRLMEFYLDMEDKEEKGEMEEMEVEAGTEETAALQGKTEKREICLSGKNSFSFKRCKIHMVKLVSQVGSARVEVEDKKGWEVKPGLELVVTYSGTALIYHKMEKMAIVVRTEKEVYMVQLFQV